MATTAHLDLTLLAESDDESTIDSVLNGNVRWLDILAQRQAHGGPLNSPPGGPSDGDTYLLGSSPTGDWSGFSAYDVAAYINGTWENRSPEEGWCFVVGGTTMRYYTGSSWSVIFLSVPEDDVFRESFMVESAPGDGDEMWRMSLGGNITLADDFSGSYGSVGTAPASEMVCVVKRDSTWIGTITYKTDGSVVFSTGGVSVLALAGQVLTVEAPSPSDGTWANIAAIIKGEYT